MTIDLVSLVLLGYGFVICLIAWDIYRIRDNIEEISDVVNEVIDKHNNMVKDFTDVANELAEEVEGIRGDRK